MDILDLENGRRSTNCRIRATVAEGGIAADEVSVFSPILQLFQGFGFVAKSLKSRLKQFHQYDNLFFISRFDSRTPNPATVCLHRSGLDRAKTMRTRRDVSQHVHRSLWPSALESIARAVHAL
ncbi:hypothetical protein L596_022029 [Steinernema carpocapsae]|uniref:Uncharacterized protein n=1 Tax=Steinernema carpocapsae TaxID=34508 RepID=A0A4U5MKI4_STECR|nr:hypothetical protein L596_022029 [Steinernema carpocapsae]